MLKGKRVEGKGVGSVEESIRMAKGEGLREVFTEGVCSMFFFS